MEDWFEDFKTDVCFTTLAWSLETPFKFWAGIDFFTGSNVDWSPIKKLIDEFMSWCKYSYLSDNSPGLLAFHEAFSASKTAY